MRKIVSTVLATSVAASLAALAAQPAAARGCNGVVNQMVCGCAYWDNNNGPQYPNWHGGSARPVGHAVPPARPVYQGGGAVYYPNQGGSLISPGAIQGSGLISPGNRNGIVAQGAGNAVPKTPQ